MKRTSKQVADLVRSIQYPATVADPEAARIIAQLRECVMNLAEQVAAHDAKVIAVEETEVALEAGENVTIAEIGKNRWRISSEDDATVTNITQGSSGTGLPDGTAEGQLLWWDHANEEWKTLTPDADKAAVLAWHDNKLEWVYLDAVYKVPRQSNTSGKPMIVGDYVRFNAVT